MNYLWVKFWDGKDTQNFQSDKQLPDNMDVSRNFYLINSPYKVVCELRPQVHGLKMLELFFQNIITK